MHLEQLQNTMERTIDTQVDMMLKNKPADRQFLNQDDIRRLGCDVEGIWLQHCGEVPAEIKASVLMANTVMAGDCLWNIAKKFLGNGAKYMTIFNLNKGILKNPNLIYPGQVLRLK